jgi:hypothetical protein
MTNYKRGLLDVLKVELEFLAKGGYRHTARAAWRPQFMFQDSPTCLNFDSTRQPRPCCECVLMQLIPEDLRRTKIPCRFIPLNEQGETIDSFYRTGTQGELEAATARWLKTTIARLEREEAESLKASEHPEVHVRARFVPVADIDP